MKKLAIETRVHVDGPANTYPYERIVDDGTILENTKGYLVKLDKNRENLIFKRRDLSPK